MSKLDNLTPSALSSNLRASISSWQRYERIVERAFHVHPQQFVFTPTLFSPATVASQMRDAIKGAIVFKYPTTLSENDLVRWFSETTIRHDKEKVYIGPRKKEKVTCEITEERETELSFQTLSLNELNAFILLLGNERIKGPVVVRKCDALRLHEVPPHPNVEIITKPDGSIILL